MYRIELFDHLPYFKSQLLSGITPARTKKSLNFTREKTLVLIERFGDRKMSELCVFIPLDKGAFSRLVEDLVQQGYVVREYAAEDRRRARLSLTEKGKAAVVKIREKMHTHLATKLAVLTEEEKDRLFKALETIGEMTDILAERESRKKK